MSNFTLSFSGDVRKPSVKEIAGKKAVEFSLMRKNFTKPDAEASFTWIKVTVFDVKDWQITQCEEGKFVAGNGELTLRSYLDKDGVKKQAAEVRCSSFGLDAPRTEDRAAAATIGAAPRKIAIPVQSANDEPPF